ncbi:MAG TPA: IclR family transcriptional regulator [Egicoccus sp.]|nr:IclR family transcriptional regulator [Egicoccus sp.]HSK21786.1 IclR family transcriptional regulator [Egicoccus sp.]
MSAAPSPGRISSVERAADVLTLFTRVDRPDLGVTEIASELGLSKAVVHRILTTLASKGLVEADETTRRYRLGPVALSLGVAYVDRIDLRSLALPVLRQLSETTFETATLSLRYGWERMYVDQITPEREVKMTVPLGRAFPLHTGSSSKAFLAFLPDDEIERFLGQHDLVALTEHTITDAETLRRELGEVRARGFAVSYGERQAGAGSVAAPVFDHRGHPVAVLSVCGPLERFRDEVPGASTALLAATRELSRQLGHI